MPTSFVVIDSRVTNFNALIASFAADSEYVVLDLERDGMVQIVEALAGKSGYSSIQIISHGAPGAITLGSTMLDSTALHGYSAELATIGSALLPAGDLMLYGCNVGAGDVGQQFVNMLAQLAGANVAASDDLTGAATFGGDWGLEVQNGAIESVVQPLVGLEGVLANSAPTLSVPTSAVVFASTIDYITGSAAQTVTPNGYASQAIVAADINGDNEIDLVITNSNSATVSVLMNDGNGSFAPKVDYSAGSGPHSVTVADVNNDALPDLVVANNWTNPKISVLLNNGNGIFASQVNYPAGADLYAVTSVDINKDGWMDIIATNASAGTITVLPNNGDGTFPTTTPASYSTGASPLAIASADFNNDGFIDLVVPNSGNSKVSVLFNNGSGGFTEKTDYNTGADTTAIRPVAVIATDINSDNNADIVIANFTSGNVSVLLNNGDGTFATISSTPSFPTYPIGNNPASISATDCNGDGKTDLVVANSGNNTVSVLLNNGDGTFATTPLSYPTGTQPYAVTTADINSDNKNDIIVTNNELGENRVSVLVNTSSVAATSFTEKTPVAVCNNIVLTDSDGDASWNGGSLKVQITGNAETTDTLSLPAVNPNNNGIWMDTSAGNIIMAGTTVIGAADAPSVTSNSKWILTFNDNATNALVQDVARSVMFNNSSDTPSELERVVTFMATDNLGAATSLEQRIAVTAVDEPTLVSATPSDNAMSLPVGSDIVLTFGENVQAGTGDIVISNGTDVRTIAITDSSQVTFDGSTMTINPTDDLHTGSNYHVVIDNGAIKDLAGNAFAGISDAETLNFGTEVINSAPTSSDNSIITDEDTAKLLSLTDFGSFADPDGTALAKVQITALESVGALQYHDGSNWTDVTLNQEITAADITTGKLRFESVANASGNVYATLGYKVSDGLLYSENAYTLTVNVSAVNDLPTVSGPLATTVAEGDPSISLNLLAIAHDVDLTDTLSVGRVSYTINGLPSALPAGITMNGNTLTIDPTNTAWNAIAQGEQKTIVATFQVLDSSAAAESSFATEVDYAAGSGPVSVTSADVNADGNSDLIVANWISSTISVLMNNGDGTFATKVDYATGSYPSSVTSTDVNGDDKSDLIAANKGGDTVSVLMNNGDGTFANKVDYATGSMPYFVSSADVSGDGKADLIVANMNSKVVSVLLNNGTGTFAEKVDYKTDYNPCTVICVDVNQDGKADLIAANGGGNTLSVLLNTGTGTFAERRNYVTEIGPRSVTSADVNGDGTVDLIAANADSNSISVFTNNGDGTFAAKMDYVTGIQPFSVTSADVNGDGKSDLITANAFSNNVSVLTSNGDGSFAARVDYEAGSGPEFVRSTDVNGDDKSDLIVANYYSGSVSVLLNTSTGFTGYPTTTETITINGTNDAPVVDATDVTGAITEMVTLVGNLTDSGTITFSDADLADIHTVSTVTPSAGAIGTLMPTITADTTGTGLGGVVTWNYSVDASAIEYLAEGEHKIETFTFNIFDDNGDSSECSVNVTITGTYDDTIAPTLTASTPSDDATAVAVDSNITFTFSENIQAGTGNIVISNGTDVRTIAVTDSSQVTFDGDRIIINPTDDLHAGSNYHVEIDNGVIQDTAGNAFAGISDAETLDFETIKALSGHITFWKTGEAIADVTTTLTALPTDGTPHAIELKNIHVKADGSHTVEVWATTPNSSTGSFECEFVLPTGANATWQDAAKLPAGWTSTSNTITSGNFLVDGMSTKPLAEGQVKLGTLTITTPIEADNLDLLLIGGQLGDNDVEGFGIRSVRSATGSGNEYRYHSLADGRYALTADKLAGAREASAVHANDALAALKMAVELNPNDDGSSVLPYQYLAADINQDGKVRANDALNILKMAVGIESVPDDEWIFVSEEVAGKTMDRSHVDWSDLAPTIDFNQTAVEIDFIGIVKGDVDGSWVGVG